jgi:putative SOS response-associated peptidase YedK
MLTVNADGHPVMQHFHKPGDEKRMVVILDPKDYGAWLTCPVADAPKFFMQWQGALDASPAPLPTAPQSSSIRTARPPPEPAGGELF